MRNEAIRSQDRECCYPLEAHLSRFAERIRPTPFSGKNPRGLVYSTFILAAAGWKDETGTVKIIFVPWPAAVWISNLASSTDALSLILANPKPSLFFQPSCGDPRSIVFYSKKRDFRRLPSEEFRQLEWDWHGARRCGLPPGRCGTTHVAPGVAGNSPECCRDQFRMFRVPPNHFTRARVAPRLVQWGSESLETLPRRRGSGGLAAAERCWCYVDWEHPKGDSVTMLSYSYLRATPNNSNVSARDRNRSDTPL